MPDMPGGDFGLDELMRLMGSAGRLKPPPSGSAGVAAMNNSPAISAPPVPARAGMFGNFGRQQPPMAQAAMPAPDAPRFTGFSSAPPSDEVFGTKPITTPGISDGIPGNLPADPRIAKALEPGMFGKGGRGWKILGVIGDALAVAGGGRPTYLPTLLEKQKLAAEQQRWLAEQQTNRAKLMWEMRKDMRPEVRGVGRSVVSVPFEGDPKVLYTAPTDAEQYAANLGLNPGDDGYSDAIMDATLHGYGPTAFGQRQALETQRFSDRTALKGTPSYANLHTAPKSPPAPRPPTATNVVANILSKASSGQKLTPGESQIYNSWLNRGRRGRTPFMPDPGAPSGAPAPVRVTSVAQARALAPGTPFITPDGQQKVR